MSVTSTRERPTLVVRTPADLAALRAGRIRPGRLALRLELPGLGEEEAQRRSQRITALGKDCGCTVGTWFALPTVCAMGVWLSVGAPGGPASLGPRIGIAVAVVMAVASIGKVAGLIGARYRMRREIDSLARRVGVAQLQDVE